VALVYDAEFVGSEREYEEELETFLKGVKAYDGVLATRYLMDRSSEAKRDEELLEVHQNFILLTGSYACSIDPTEDRYRNVIVRGVNFDERVERLSTGGSPARYAIVYRRGWKAIAKALEVEEERVPAIEVRAVKRNPLQPALYRILVRYGRVDLMPLTVDEVPPEMAGEFERLIERYDVPIDEKEERILEILREDPWTPHDEIARRLGLSVAEVEGEKDPESSGIYSLWARVVVNIDYDERAAKRHVRRRDALLEEMYERLEELSERYLGRRLDRRWIIEHKRELMERYLEQRIVECAIKLQDQYGLREDVALCLAKAFDGSISTIATSPYRTLKDACPDLTLEEAKSVNRTLARLLDEYGLDPEVADELIEHFESIAGILGADLRDVERMREEGVISEEAYRAVLEIQVSELAKREGIGRKTAERLIRAFGSPERVKQLAREFEIEKLASVEGVGEKALRSLVPGYSSLTSIRGIDRERAEYLLKKYGGYSKIREASVEELREDGLTDAQIRDLKGLKTLERIVGSLERADELKRRYGSAAEIRRRPVKELRELGFSDEEIAEIKNVPKKLLEAFDLETAVELYEEYGSLREIARNVPYERLRELGATPKAAAEIKGPEFKLLLSVDGVGPKLAERVLEAVDYDLERLAELNPEELAEKVEGLGEKLAERIVYAARERVARRREARRRERSEEEWKEWLEERVGRARARRLIEHFGSAREVGRAIEERRVTELLEVEGIGDAAVAELVPGYRTLREAGLTPEEIERVLKEYGSVSKIQEEATPDELRRLGLGDAKIARLLGLRTLVNKGLDVDTAYRLKRRFGSVTEVRKAPVEELRKLGLSDRKIARIKGFPETMLQVRGMSLEKAERLLERFGTWTRVKEAPVSELIKVPGVGPELAKEIKSMENPAWRCLLEVKGVSPELADRLVEKFGSPYRVLTARKEDLMKVEGVGPKLAERIREAGRRYREERRSRRERVRRRLRGE
jgi:ERCC4-type nuclease/truncated hemoglobin YjbI